LAKFARGFSQAQRRALGIRRNKCGVPRSFVGGEI
jgi:hypothetical protein